MKTYREEVGISRKDEGIKIMPKSLVHFATTNLNKFREAEQVVAKYGIKLRHLKSKPDEIQSQNIKYIAETSATQIVKETSLSLIVEDAGLFVETLNGFPGPFSSYVYRTIGTNGILKLLEGKSDRTAYFLSAVVYCAPKLKPKVFVGKIKGV
ncbi:MAG: non-canonical purine NTP pyrophosphatase, partial [Candidatus Bathyarchaeota archaeon]